MATESDHRTQEEAAVAAVAAEYFQAWFAGDGKRMRAVLHPHLAKRCHRSPETDSLVLHEDPMEALVEDTATGEGTTFEPSQHVTVCDVSDTIASVVVQSEPFTEYLHTGPIRRALAHRQRSVPRPGISDSCSRGGRKPGQLLDES
ncbi:MAG: nuclear transport factor 2 family protein [Actinomycetota bacterium]